MCFVTYKSKIRLARKNIECYKIVKKGKNICFKNYCFSQYQEFKYEYGKTYSGKSKMRLFLRWIFDIYVSDEAYHSYNQVCYPVNPFEVVKCIIPKGSLYLISEDGIEYVSTSIKILKP